MGWHTWYHTHISIVIWVVFGSRGHLGWASAILGSPVFGRGAGGGGSVPEGNIPLRFEAPPSHKIEGMGSSPVHGVVLHLRGCEGRMRAACELCALGGRRRQHLGLAGQKGAVSELCALAAAPGAGGGGA